MRFKVQLTRLLMAGVLTVMTAGISHAGGANWCPCDDGPIITHGGEVYVLAVVQAMGSVLTAIVNIL